MSPPCEIDSARLFSQLGRKATMSDQYVTVEFPTGKRQAAGGGRHHPTRPGNAPTGAARWRDRNARLCGHARANAKTAFADTWRKWLALSDQHPDKTPRRSPRRAPALR